MRTSQNLVYIVLNYNSGPSTVECVKNIQKVTNSLSRIIVIDNHSTDDSMLFLQRIEENNVEIIQASRNGGYAAGNNIGLRRAQELGAEFAIIMNPDVSITEDIGSKLRHYMVNNQTCGIVAPALESQNEDTNYGEIIHLGRIHFEEKVYSTDNQPVVDIDSIVGACFMVRLSVIEVVGYISEDYFLNFEETEWCLKIKHAGFNVVCVPSCRAFHVGEEAINKVSGMQVYFLRRNLVLFNKRMINGFQFAFFLSKIFLLATAQCLKHWSFIPFLSYLDGLTERNRLLEEKKLY